jgi:hypothetical protein
MVRIPNPALPVHAGADERSSLAMSSPGRKRGSIHLPISAGAFVALICVAILVLSDWREWSTREAELKNAEVDVANLSESLTQHADDTLELADNVLTGLVHRLGIDGTAPDAIARLQTFIDLRKSSLGRIRGLFIYDETGNWLATSEAVSLKGLNNSDRAYFRHHAQSDDHRTLIGRPVKSRSGGQWIITVSRRFNHPDGRFAGVALATVDVAYFSQFFQEIQYRPKRGGCAAEHRRHRACAPPRRWQLCGSRFIEHAALQRPRQLSGRRCLLFQIAAGRGSTVERLQGK